MNGQHLHARSSDKTAALDASLYQSIHAGATGQQRTRPADCLSPQHAVLLIWKAFFTTFQKGQDFFRFW